LQPPSAGDLEIAAPWASNAQEINLERASASRYFWRQFFASLISGSAREIPCESGAVALL